MLQDLREELLGGILAWLKNDDVQHARLACRALDAAARTQLPAAASIMLQRGKGGTPDWARFPQLATINVWWSIDSSAETDLLRCFSPAPGAAGAAARAILSHVSALNLVLCPLAPPSLSALLAALPGLTELGLPHGLQGEAAESMLAAAAAAAPRLARLTVDHCAVTVAAAVIISDMQHLRALRLGAAPRGVSWPEVLAALPVQQLTSLAFFQFKDAMPVLHPTAAPIGLPWRQLRELRGIKLPYDSAEALAAGLPALALLVAQPTGKWGPTPAAFPYVAHAKFLACRRSFAGARLSALLPSLESLVLQGSGGVFDDYSLEGLSALTLLQFEHDDGARRLGPISDAALATVCELPSLAHTSFIIERSLLPRLRQLPASLRGLELYVPADVADEDDDTDGCAMNDSDLLATTVLTQLAALHLTLDCRDSSFASQATPGRFIHALPRLRKLVLSGPALQLHEVAVLAAHPALQTLMATLQGGRGLENTELFGQLAADHAVRGLQLHRLRKSQPPLLAPLTWWVHGWLIH